MSHSIWHHIGGVMIKRARLRCGRSWVRAPDRTKPKTIKLVFVASPLSTQH